MMVAILSIAPITIDTILDIIDNTVEQHLPTNHSSRAPKGAHGIFSSITLHEASQPPGLTLHRHILRHRYNPCKTCMTTHTGRSTQWRHRHTGRTTQHHRRLSQHRLWLIAALNILLWILLLRIGRLSIWLLILWLWILRILLLWILSILARRRIIWLSTRSYRELIATTCTEMHTRSILSATICAKDRSRSST